MIAVCQIWKLLSVIVGSLTDGGFGMLVPYVISSLHSAAYLLIKGHTGAWDNKPEDWGNVVPNHLAASQTVGVLTGGYFMMFFFVTGIEVRDWVALREYALSSRAIGWHSGNMLSPRAIGWHSGNMLSRLLRLDRGEGGYFTVRDWVELRGREYALSRCAIGSRSGHCIPSPLVRLVRAPGIRSLSPCAIDADAFETVRKECRRNCSGRRLDPYLPVGVLLSLNGWARSRGILGSTSTS
eukprot:1184569-Prorocentrum_minimum.AAC.1